MRQEVSVEKEVAAEGWLDDHSGTIEVIVEPATGKDRVMGSLRAGLRKMEQVSPCSADNPLPWW